VGSQLTLVGNFSDVASPDLQNAVAIGYQAIATASNSIQLGNNSIEAVVTSGALTTGAVTYPNVEGAPGQVLAASGNGIVSWTDAVSAQEVEDLKAIVQQQVLLIQELTARIEALEQP